MKFNKELRAKLTQFYSAREKIQSLKDNGQKRAVLEQDLPNLTRTVNSLQPLFIVNQYEYKNNREKLEGSDMLLRS